MNKSTTRATKLYNRAVTIATAISLKKNKLFQAVTLEKCWFEIGITIHKDISGNNVVWIERHALKGQNRWSSWSNLLNIKSIVEAITLLSDDDNKNTEKNDQTEKEDKYNPEAP